MRKNKFYLLCTVLSLFFLIAFTLSFSILTKKISESPTKEKEYIHVYVVPDETETEAYTFDEKWIVKDHNGKIGIFNVDGTVYRLLDTYTKTLPKAEQELLREGIEISSKKELYSVIEAYTD